MHCGTNLNLFRLWAVIAPINYSNRCWRQVRLPTAHVIVLLTLFTLGNLARASACYQAEPVDEPSLAAENSEVREVRFRDGDRLREVLGEVLVEAVDGGILLQGADGRQWAIQPEEIENSRAGSGPLVPLTSEQIEAELLQELPAGFKVLRTDHYVLMYNTTKAYCQWTGNLL